MVPKYFPDPRDREQNDKEEPVMNEARLAVKLVERHGLTTKQAMRVVLESDADGASKLMAQNAAPEDPKKQKELAKDFKEQMQKAMDSDDKDKKEVDEPAEGDDDDKPHDEDDDDKIESRRRRR